MRVNDELLRVTVFAPAKVNLTLHVTGQRDDGYHTLDSLIAFATRGDTVTVTPGDVLSLRCVGPEGDNVPDDADNLILKVARQFQDMPGAAFLLEKHLPIASGIGGGSADAAAAFRALMCIWSGGETGDDAYDPGQTPFAERLLTLGADIPVCLSCKAARMQGVGEMLSLVDNLPGMDAVLVNPRVGVSTPRIFKALDDKNNAPMPARLPRFAGVYELALWLKEQRNDLQAPAMALVPEIRDVIDALEHDKDCMFARMSGSGATCFGIFPNKERARDAAERIAKANPAWWVRNTRLTSMSNAAKPRLEWASDAEAAEAEQAEAKTEGSSSPG